MCTINALYYKFATTKIKQLIMKKVFLSLTMITALVFTSCKETPKDDAEGTPTEETVGTTAEKDVKDTAPVATDGVPNFSDADVQAYVDSYESYMADYKKAVESKDMTAFATLGQKGQDLAAKAQEVTGKLTGADAEKLTAYMTKKGEELTAYAAKMME